MGHPTVLPSWQNESMSLHNVSFSRKVSAAALITGCASCLGAFAQSVSPADVEDPPRVGLHAQATYIWQVKPAFNAA